LALARTYNQSALDEEVFAGLRFLAGAPRPRPVTKHVRKLGPMPRLLPQRNARQRAAPRLSPFKQRAGRLLPSALVLLWLVLGTSSNFFAANVALRKQKARDQFDKAEQMREALNGRPEEERTRRDYQRVADAYRKVYYVAPDSSKADASVVAVAELLAEMGRQFQPGDIALGDRFFCSYWVITAR